LSDLFGIGGGGKQQNSLTCDQMTMELCNNNPFNKMLCPTECKPDVNSWAQCRKWAENGECINNSPYMNVPMKEGGCKEACDQQNQNIAAMKALMDSNPIFRNLITTK